MKKLLSLFLALVMLSSTVFVSSFVSFAEDVEEAATEEAVATEEIISDDIREAETNIVEEEPEPIKESENLGTELAKVHIKGKLGDNLTYDLNETVLTISGMGEMINMSSSYYLPWYDYQDSIKTIIINEGVTSVGDYAFYSFDKLNSITFPSTLKSIGSRSFSNCSSLTYVAFNEGLESIGSMAFYYCRALKNIIFSDTVKFIGSEAFYSCQANIQLGSGIETIGYRAFHFGFATDYTDLVLPNSVKVIHDEAFRNCSFVTVDLGDGVETLGEMAFTNCDKLESVYLGKNVETLSLSEFALSAFYDCDVLTDITVSEQNPYFASVNGILYNKSMETLKLYPQGRPAEEFTVPDGVKTLGVNSFRDSSHLLKINLPDTLEVIWAYAFYNSALKNVAVPDSVTTIGESAFDYCDNLSELELGNGIREIGKRAFVGTPAFTNGIDENDIVYIGNYLITARTDTEGEIVVKPGTVAIADEAFEDEVFITNVVLPDSLKSIGYYAFSSSSVNSINFPEGLEYIGYSAFDSCRYLTEIHIPSSVKKIGSHAFYNCSMLDTITIEDGVEKILDYAFYSTAIEEITFPKSVTEIGSIALGMCDNLKSVRFPDSDARLGGYLFYNCTGLEKVYFSDEITSISDGCFYGCTALTEILIPDNITSIASDAFYNVKKLIIKCFPESAAIEFAKANKISYDIVCSKCYASCINEDVLREADCMYEGLKLYLYSCGDYTVKLHARTDHSFTNYVYNNDATCTTYGTKSAYCDYGCGIQNTVVTDIKAHSFTDYIYNDDATCSNDGTQTAYCDFGCGISNTVTAPNTKLEHIYKTDVISEPNCKRTGMLLYICLCNYYYTEVLPVTDVHVGEWNVDVWPTVNTEGQKSRVCDVCGVTETEAIAKIEIPVLDTDNYVVSITSAEYIKYISYAYGQYSSYSEIKNASDCVTLNQRSVQANTNNDTVYLTMAKGGCYTFRIKLTDGSEYIYIADLTVMNQSVEVNGPSVTVCDLYGVKDFFIGYGEHDSYRAVKDNLLVQITSKKIGEDHDYSYTISKSGIYTLCIRYEDALREYKFITFEVVLPEVVFTEMGSQLNVSGIEDIKVLRYAYGEYNSVAEIKRAEGAVSYSGKGRLKDINEYTLSFTKEGTVSISLVFNNGYSVIYKYKV